MLLRHLIRGRLENAHWNGQHGGPGDVHLNCYSEILGAGVRLEMIEKWMGSENTETPYGPLSRSVVLRENSPKPIHPQSLLLTLPCHSVSWSDFLIWYLMFHSCGLPGAMATSQPGRESAGEATSTLGALPPLRAASDSAGLGRPIVENAAETGFKKQRVLIF